jgi:hypothetical protein
MSSSARSPSAPDKQTSASRFRRAADEPRLWIDRDRTGLTDIGNRDPLPRLDGLGLGARTGLRLAMGLYNIRTGIRVRNRSNPYPACPGGAMTARPS